MAYKSLRNTVGMASLTALALTMVACGGSSSSTPAVVTPTNNAPTPVQISSGPTSAITNHQYTYNLFSTDADGDTITYALVSSTGAAGDVAISGSVLTYKPSAAGAVVLKVKATDSKGAVSDIAGTNGNIAITVIANHQPQFVTQPTGVIPGSGSAIPSVGSALTVVAVDQDADNVNYLLSGLAVTNNLGGTFNTAPTASLGTGASANVVTFTGSVATNLGTATSITYDFDITASDVLAVADTASKTTQHFKMTFFSGNVAPIITTTSIPAVPQNHGIPLNTGIPPFQFAASDPGDTLTWGPAVPAPGFALSAAGVLTWNSGFATGTDFNKRSITVRVTDAGGLWQEKIYDINIVPDTLPNFQAGLLPTEVVAGTGDAHTGHVANVLNYFDQSLVRGLAPGKPLAPAGFVVASPDANYITEQAKNDQGKSSNNVLANPASNASLVIAQANDAEGDKVRFSITSQSVFRGGIPVVAGNMSYPSVQSDDGASISGITGETQKAGTMLWTPIVSETTGDGTAFTVPAASNVGTVANPLFFTYKMKLQQMINGAPTSNQVVDTNTISVKTERNNTPKMGPLDEIYDSVINHGVFTGGGSHVADKGRPSLQEPNTPNNLSDAGLPASLWIWNVLAPNAAYAAVDYTTGEDAVIRDPNSIGREGHQDAIALSMPAAGFPLWDNTGAGNKPFINLTNSITDLFYNPWTMVGDPGNFEVDWQPIREQYMKGRYIGAVSYTFKPTAVDQYDLASERVINVSPIFGVVKIANSRFYNEADGTEAFYRRGNYTSSANGRNAGSNARYIFRYLPAGMNPEATNEEWIDSATNLTYGSFLFGRPSDNKGAIASGYAGGVAGGVQGAGSLVLPAIAAATQQSAGYWVEHDGVASAAYGVNPLNQLLNPASTAKGVVGTAASTDSINYVAGAYLTPWSDLGLSKVDVSGDFANNAAWAELVPSNTYYHFSQTSVSSPTANNHGWDPILGIDLTTPVGTSGMIQLNVPSQLNRWYQGKYQSEVNYFQTIPGRSVYFSTAPTAALLADAKADITGLGTVAGAGYRARLRFNYTWPSNVTNAAPLMAVTVGANTFGANDFMQVATPNLSGNARFFFTGNDAGGVFGVAGSKVASTTTVTGTTATTAWPLHAASNSIWLPNAAALTGATALRLDGSFNWPNTSTVATGSLATDVPFTGTKGFIDPTAATWDAAAQARLLDKSLAYRVANNTTANLPQAGMINNYDNVANPALLDLNAGDRSVFLWMKPTIAGVPALGTAFASFGGSILSKGATWTQTGGATTVTATNDPVTALHMNDTQGVMGLTDIGAQIIFSDGAAGSNNQPMNQTWGVTTIARNLYFQYKDEVAATNQPFTPSRAKVAIPTLPVSYSANTELQVNSFMAQSGNGAWGAAADNADGYLKDGVTVYGVRKHAGQNIGAVGIEPGSPVLAQWYNIGNTRTDVGAITVPAGSFYSPLPAAEFAHVVEFKTNFIGALVHPALWGTAAGATPVVADITGNTNLVAKIPLSMGFAAETSDAATIALAAARPLLTPVKQLRINDMVMNTATGVYTPGTTLDIANGTTNDVALGSSYGNYPNWRLYLDGNATTTDYRIHGASNVRVQFQVPTTDPKANVVSGFIVTVYRIDNDATALLNPLGATATHSTQIAEYRFGYDTRDIWQNLYLPSFRTMDNTIPATALTGNNAFYAIKVRSTWMSDGANRIDMEKTPFAQGFPMAYADFLSGVFAVRMQN